MRRTATTHVLEPMRSRPRWPAAAGLVLGLLLSGCGGGGDAGTAATDSAAQGSASGESTAPDDSAATTAAGGDSTTGGDGCDLISDDLAAQILGIEIVRREPHMDATTGGVSCIKGTERVTDLSTAYYVSASVTPGGAAFFDQTLGEADAWVARVTPLIAAAGGCPGRVTPCIAPVLVALAVSQQV